MSESKQQTCPRCEYYGEPCPGGAHVFALYEDGIRTVEDYVAKCVHAPAEQQTGEMRERLNREMWAPEPGSPMARKAEETGLHLFKMNLFTNRCDICDGNSWEKIHLKAELFPHPSTRNEPEIPEAYQEKLDPRGRTNLWPQEIPLVCAFIDNLERMYSRELERWATALKENRDLRAALTAKLQAAEKERDKAVDAGWNEAIDAATEVCLEWINSPSCKPEGACDHQYTADAIRQRIQDMRRASLPLTGETKG